MVYNTPVFFQTLTEGAYNAETGDYGDDVISEVPRYASVVDTPDGTAQIVYGTIRQGSRTITLQRAYTGSFDLIRIGDRRYRVDDMRSPHGKGIYICSEVP